MQPVCELDEDDSDVVRHREDHFAKILRLLFFVIAEGNLADLGNPVDKMDNVFAELFLEFVRSVSWRSPATIAVTSVFSDVSTPATAIRCCR
jgi:hypothetical protein